MKRTISIPETYEEKLKKEKQETGQTISDIIRRALDYYFERQGCHNSKTKILDK